MRDTDLSDFTNLLKRVAAVFRRKIDGPEFTALTTSYFRALRYHDVRDLERGADHWIAHQTQFPRPAEWAAAVPRGVTLDVPTLTALQAREHLRAEGLGFEDAPCACSACVEANVQEKPLRFVPNVAADGSDQRALLGERVVTVGYWAHGWELAGYYRARADFWNAYFTRFPDALKQRDRATLPEGRDAALRRRSEWQPMGAEGR